jgi:hypothetical protein
VSRYKLVLIEFIAATDNRAVGDRMRVDPTSAIALCDRQKVAVRVDLDTPLPPAPATVPEIQGDEDDDATDQDDTDLVGGDAA